MKTIISFAILIISVLNLFGGIISSIVLLFQGVFKPVLVALLLGVSSSFLIGLAMMPTSFFIVPALKAFDKGQAFMGYLFSFISNAYVFTILYFWAVWVFNTITGYIGKTGSGEISLIILSYIVAISPIQFLASKENDNEFTQLTTIMFTLSSLFFMLLLMFNFDFQTAKLYFSIALTISCIIELAMIAAIVKTSSHYYES